MGKKGIFNSLRRKGLELLLAAGISFAYGAQATDYVTLGTRASNSNLFSGSAAQSIVDLDSTTTPTNKIRSTSWDVIGIPTNLINITGAKFPVGTNEINKDFFYEFNMDPSAILNRIDSTVDSGMKLADNDRYTDQSNPNWPHYGPLNRKGILGLYDFVLRDSTNFATTNLNVNGVTIIDENNTSYKLSNGNLARTNQSFNILVPKENLITEMVLGGKTNRHCRVAYNPSDTNLVVSSGLDIFDHQALLKGTNTSWDYTLMSDVANGTNENVSVITDARGTNNEGIVRADAVIERGNTNSISISNGYVEFKSLNGLDDKFVHTANVQIDGQYTTNGPFREVRDLSKDATNGVVRINFPYLSITNADTNPVSLIKIQTDRRSLTPSLQTLVYTNGGINRNGNNLTIDYTSLPATKATDVLEGSTNMSSWYPISTNITYSDVTPENFGGLDVLVSEFPLPNGKRMEFYRMRRLSFETVPGVNTN